MAGSDEQWAPIESRDRRRSLPIDVVSTLGVRTTGAVKPRDEARARADRILAKAAPLEVSGVDLGPDLALVAADRASSLARRIVDVDRIRALLRRTHAGRDPARRRISPPGLAGRRRRRGRPGRRRPARRHLAAPHRATSTRTRPPELRLPGRTYVFGPWERDVLTRASVYRPEEVVVGGSPRLDLVGSATGAAWSPADDAPARAGRRAGRPDDRAVGDLGPPAAAVPLPDRAGAAVRCAAGAGARRGQAPPLREGRRPVPRDHRGPRRGRRVRPAAGHRRPDDRPLPAARRRRRPPRDPLDAAHRGGRHRHPEPARGRPRGAPTSSATSTRASRSPSEPARTCSRCSTGRGARSCATRTARRSCKLHFEPGDASRRIADDLLAWMGSEDGLREERLDRRQARTDLATAPAASRPPTALVPWRPGRPPPTRATGSVRCRPPGRAASPPGPSGRPRAGGTRPDRRRRRAGGCPRRRSGPTGGSHGHASSRGLYRALTTTGLTSASRSRGTDSRNAANATSSSATSGRGGRARA